MALRGSQSDAGPGACPFVALELDRDRRSERPDHRHRCYAEQLPAPRTVAHQERFCLSPNFSGCPIFQDWAVRAAARPVPLPPGHDGGRRATPDPRAPVVAAAEPIQPATAPIQSAASEPEADADWPDSMATSVPIVTATDAAEGLAPEPVAEQQLSAFEAQPVDHGDSAPEVDEPPYEPPASTGPATAALPVPPRAPMDRMQGTQPRAYVAADPIDLEEPDGAAVPAFLAGRSSRPPRPTTVGDPVGRDDVVPSWEIDGRYGAQAGSEPRGDSGFGRLLTLLAVVIILGLGVAAVILIPGLLGGSPQATIRPSVLRTASPAASGFVVVPSTSAIPLTTPTQSAEPTAAATPAPSPRFYKVKSGDTLAKIARKNGTTVDDILAANPEITDANDIRVGQFIVIPPAP